MAILISFIAASLPAVLIYFWMKNKVRKPADEHFKKSCSASLKNGFLTVLPVCLLSASFTIFFNVCGLKDGTSFMASALHDFIAIALAEELAKSYMFSRVLKKTDYAYTWLDMIIFMVSVSIGFQLIESVLYAFLTSPGQIIVRGITLMHGGYGFIEGWFYGKAKHTGNKLYGLTGFMIVWLMHGMYDFGLSPAFEALGDWSAFPSVTLALIALITLIVMIIFFARKKKEKYLLPLADGHRE
ncbi:MAG: PrsW family intramembrane metalloprotease [Solobacterium sp.]|nr:PrsW family intramembrane metalloprotease [Solobacterium sp.]